VPYITVPPAPDALFEVPCPPPALQIVAPKEESPPLLAGNAPEVPPPPIHSTEILVTPAGTVKVYVPAVVYA
jgi:hypothetical protein